MDTQKPKPDPLTRYREIRQKIRTKGMEVLTRDEHDYFRKFNDALKGPVTE